jgi:hypothetical protein
MTISGEGAISPPHFLFQPEDEMKATHGFSIIEHRDGLKIAHYPKRSVQQYETAKCRVLALARDRRLKHLSERTFHIWDGTNPVSKITVKRNGSYVEVPYLLQPLTYEVELANGTLYRSPAFIQKMGYDLDYKKSTRSRLKNQRVGRDASDLSSWIKAKPLDKVPCTIVGKPNYTMSERIIQRSHGSTERLKEMFPVKKV